MKNEYDYQKQKVRLTQMAKLQRERKKGNISGVEIAQFLCELKTFYQIIDEVKKNENKRN